MPLHLTELLLGPLGRPLPPEATEAPSVQGPLQEPETPGGPPPLPTCLQWAPRDVPCGPVAKTVVPMQGAQVQDLIRELDPPSN